MNVVLLGFKSSGKSTVGRALAKRTGRDFVDADNVTENLYESWYGSRLSCREIYVKHGDDFMRRLETDALRSLAGLENTVLATGGGAVLRPENIPLLQSIGTCFFLDTPATVLKQRLTAHNDSPLFHGNGVDELIKKRHPLYLAAAHKGLAAASNADPETLAAAIASLLSS